MSGTELLLRRLVLLVGNEALRKVKPHIGSKTLREAIALEVQAGGRGRLVVPHYWAAFYHDGRGSFGPVDAVFLIYYRDPKQDPRIANGYPVKRSQVKKLTTDQFRAAVAANRRARLQGQPPPVIFRRLVGPWKGDPFFEEGTRGMAQVAGPIVKREFRLHVRNLLGSVLSRASGGRITIGL